MTVLVLVHGDVRCARRRRLAHGVAAPLVRARAHLRLPASIALNKLARRSSRLVFHRSNHRSLLSPLLARCRRNCCLRRDCGRQFARFLVVFFQVEYLHIARAIAVYRPTLAARPIKQFVYLARLLGSV